MFSGKAQRNTFVFLVAIPNWVFLPLPIAQALYGDTGVRTVLLCNAGAQLVLWSFGVWILHGSIRQAARNLLTNIGLWATAAGIAMALLFPAARDLETINPTDAFTGHDAARRGGAGAGHGRQPDHPDVAAGHRRATRRTDHRRASLSARVVGRVAGVGCSFAPLATVAIGFALMKMGFVIPEETRMILYLIAAMPVAISCSVMAERFHGDVTLAAEGIFYSTFFSLLTVPAIFYLIQRFGL